MIKKFKKAKNKNNNNNEVNKDVYSQLSKTGIHLLGEILRNGIKIIDNYNENSHSLQLMNIITDILDEIFECKTVNYIDILHKLHDDKKDLELENDEYIISFIKIIHEQTGNEDAIKLRWTEG